MFIQYIQFSVEDIERKCGSIIIVAKFRTVTKDRIGTVHIQLNVFKFSSCIPRSLVCAGVGVRKAGSGE